MEFVLEDTSYSTNIINLHKYYSDEVPHLEISEDVGVIEDVSSTN